MQYKTEIPVFFSSDQNYLPYLAVAIQSIKETASKDNLYRITVLNDRFSETFTSSLNKLQSENVKISFANVSEKIAPYRQKMLEVLRDYYSVSIFYRMFIASLFPDLDKAIYIDCDVVALTDIKKLFDIKTDDCIFGACIDQVVSVHDAFKVYVENYLGIPQKNYFNSGVLLMNLKEYRKQKIEEKFLYILTKYNPESVAPDQDYLNVLCKDKIKYLEPGFDRMPTAEVSVDYPLYIIHYNMFNKPWLYDDVLYGEYFWQYAKNTEFFAQLKNMQKNYSEQNKKADLEARALLLNNSAKLAEQKNAFKSILEKENL